ncbi:hypothetical protein SK069_15980 [Patulibacter brassicae]|uniref:Thioredoxin domain-containing protein n=1 Tax=Patulibacter brassicae TaxID=1705717 RepID=A0ABU4VMN5_9ACTN|nr:hypothetical protein [Patulibacter brassicae]MDX8153099.1 hypothetical protein [Patulibacter brassicae]
MSDGGDRREDERPEDDPLGFAPDDRDRGDVPAPDRGEDDPLGFAPDDRDRGDVPAPAPAPDVDGPRRPVVRRGPTLSSPNKPQTGRYLAIAGILLLVVATISTLAGRDRTGGVIDPGDELPPFAAPLATAPKLDHDDVNLATAANQGDAGSRPACSIRNPSVVTSCALLERGPLVLVLYSQGIDQCVRAVDALDRLRAREPSVSTLAVAVLGEHGETARTARDRRWALPVVYDHDGALSTRLGVPACPFVVTVRRDGTVLERLVGGLSSARLAAAVRRLVSDDRAPRRTTTAPTPGR